MLGLENNYRTSGITAIIALFFITIVGLAGCDEQNSAGPDPNPEPDEDHISAVVSEDSTLKTFSGILIQTGLDADLESEGPFTVFAPTDSAFHKLPEGLLDDLNSDQIEEIVTYHLVSGAMLTGDIQQNEEIETNTGAPIFVRANNDIELNHKAVITEGDKEVSNGVIHKIDNVLLPDAYLTVFGAIQKRYSLSKFACYCTSGRTDLDEVLEDESSEFTVFVPTDEAFENFEQNVDDLSDSELREILNYHVVEQKILSDELSDGQTLTTRNGEDLMISVANDGTVTLNGDRAVVQRADIEGKNGVVYIIDAVVDPHSGSGM
jgi:transforming growth factor-beta-induced protein